MADLWLVTVDRDRGARCFQYHPERHKVRPSGFEIVNHLVRSQIKPNTRKFRFPNELAGCRSYQCLEHHLNDEVFEAKEIREMEKETRGE